MVTPRTQILWVFFVVVTAGCVETLPVRLDLCPATTATASDLDLIQRVDLWSIVILGIEDGDVAWRRTYAGAHSVTSIVIDDALPPGEEVRLLVEGYGTDPLSERRLLALGSSEPLVFNELDRVCLCVAPPEQYAALCTSWSCTWDDSSRRCTVP